MTFISISDLWNAWNIRGFVMLSLMLQVFLILFAPLRKKIANNHILSLLWLAYLMADWVAAFAIGLISHNQGNSLAREAEVNGAIQAFWASFLLLHLGGPDTITAFSLEDSLLWRRHLLNLICQVSAVIYVFVQIFLSDKLLVIPTMLVFFIGIIKNAERTLALNLSSLPRLRESIHPFYSISSEEWNWFDKESNVLGDGYSDEEEAKLPESIVVKHAYHFFQIFKVFLVDLIFTINQREESLNYFRKVSPLDALRVISIELQFMYEVLHTKAVVIHSKWSYIFRFITLNVLVVALILFNRLNKHRLLEFDIKITYFLLFGGISLDVIALFMLIFSDWTFAKIRCHSTTSTTLDSILHKLVSTTDYLRKARSATCKVEPNANDTYEILDTPLIFRRWSESISACSLFSEVWEEHPRKMYKCEQGWATIAFSNICSFLFRTTEKIISSFHQAWKTIIKGCPRRTSLIAHAKYVSKNPFIKKLWIFIFKEVRCKSHDADDETKVREIFEARGNLFLGCGPGGIDCRNLLKYVTEVNYDSSILCWHIATELWYKIEKPTERKEEREYREFSKILSDYMLYLLFKQPNVMFAVVGNAQFTTSETLVILRSIIRETKDVKHFIENPLDHSEFLFPQGFELAQEIKRLGEMKWKVMSGVWVEILTYAATHIKGEAHVQVLSKGGELLTFVWLLMTHFGCFYKLPWGMIYGMGAY